MDWNVLIATIGTLGGVVIGSVLTWWFQRNLAARQLEYQQRHDVAERLVAFRQDYVLALQKILGDLIALAIREVPQRSIGFDELTIDPDKWPKDWKMMHDEQDQLRDSINRLALMSPFRSTVDHARRVVERIDDYAKAENSYENFYDSWDEEADENERKQLVATYESLSKTHDETRQELLDAAYAFRQHLEALISRPESDPG